MTWGDVLTALRETGITTYRMDAPASTRRSVRVKVIDRPGDLPDADIVVLAVKNYSWRLWRGKCAIN